MAEAAAIVVVPHGVVAVAVHGAVAAVIAHGAVAVVISAVEARLTHGKF